MTTEQVAARRGEDLLRSGLRYRAEERLVAQGNNQEEVTPALDEVGSLKRRTFLLGASFLQRAIARDTCCGEKA